MARPPREFRASDLHHRITLEALTESAASSGALAKSYDVVGPVWARVTALRGGRYVYGEQTERVATHEVLLRYRSDFRDVTHFSFDGRRFIVREARDPDERKVSLRFLAEEMHDDA